MKLLKEFFSDPKLFLIKYKTFTLAVTLWIMLFAIQLCFPSPMILFSSFLPAIIPLRIFGALSLPFNSSWTNFVNIIGLVVIFYFFTRGYLLLCSWVIKKQNLFKYFFVISIICTIASSSYFYATRINYESWKYTESVQLRISCPEGNNAYYKPNTSDYHNEITFPAIFGGAMIGLHIALALTAMVALVSRLKSCKEK
ncbi:hypothetical protein AAEX28_06340 [Lentisphaerota bacterium WC36G]|nr:hypothetical protein LJT99_09205 [Lentisphaerae bacterium WC36]